MEIKVLDKALSILEVIGERDGDPVSAKELLKLLPDLTQPTCVRLVKSLCTAGYLAQLPHHKAYILGPLVGYLGHHCTYRKDLIVVAKPVLESFSATTGQSVQLTVRHGFFRTIPFGINAPGGVKLNLNRPRYSDFKLSTSGRLLLSGMPKRERTEYFKEYGYEGCESLAPENTEAVVTKVLDELRATGTLFGYYSGRFSGATLVSVGGVSDVAVASAWSATLEARNDEFMRHLKLAARDISEALSGGTCC